MTVHQFFCILHFCHTCSICSVELVVHIPARGSTKVSLRLCPGVLWLRHFLYSVSPQLVVGVRFKCYYAFFLVCCCCDTSYIVSVHIQCQAYIYTFFVTRAFMAGAASQAGDADSSRAPGLTSGFQGSVNVHRGALLFVQQ